MHWRILLLLLMKVALLRAAELTVAIEPRWKGAVLTTPSGELTNESGQKIRVTRLAGLMSQVSLLRVDGGVVRLDGQYGFFDASRGRLEMPWASVPDGDYAGFELRLGLPPAINHADSGQWSAGHPLNPLVNQLHWGWQGGYVFFALEGRWRTNEERGFSYHLATDARQTTLRFTANFRVAGATTVTLAFDLARVLAEQSLAADDGSETTHSRTGDELASRLNVRLERAWFFLGSQSTESDRRQRVDDDRSGGPRHFNGVTPFAFTVPRGFPQPLLPLDNPLTMEGIALGETLFGDVRLSGNGTQSCASCHAPTRAFSDGVSLSRGAEGRAGVRNAMPLFNLAWNPAFAWDGAKLRVRDQALAAMTNPVEMHAAPNAVVAALAGDDCLDEKFAAAFGDGEATIERITLALEQYLLSLVSADSKFDRAARGEVMLTDEEARGFHLFATEYDPVRGQHGADCFHCHGGSLFSDFGFKNNGLDRRSADVGRAHVTGLAADTAKFKTASLRNVALTAPYMHDGRFATLEDVIAHYDHGVQRNPTLDPNLAKHPNLGLQLSAADQRALVAFLRTLTQLSL